MSFQQSLHRVLSRDSLSTIEAREAFGEIMLGSVPPVQLAAFLAALRVKGESVTEITGAAQAMRHAAMPLKIEAGLILDCCGTGGDAQGSFNVSSAVACVVAGAGYTVAKHGNRSVSSKSGSADVLEASGVHLEMSVATVEKCLTDIGFAFLFAQSFHPAMKHAAAVRRELGTRTIFNLLGPLTNPAHPHVQLVGVFSEDWLAPIAHSLVALGCREGLVVHGQGHDELVMTGTNQVARIHEGKISAETWTAEDFGLKTNPKALIPGGTVQENAVRMQALLAGEERGVLKDVVCMNAAALIQAASNFERPGRAYSLEEGLEAAQNSIERGQALLKLQRLARFSQTGAHA